MCLLSCPATSVHMSWRWRINNTGLSLCNVFWADLRDAYCTVQNYFFQTMSRYSHNSVSKKDKVSSEWLTVIFTLHRCLDATGELMQIMYVSVSTRDGLSCAHQLSHNVRHIHIEGLKNPRPYYEYDAHASFKHLHLNLVKHCSVCFPFLSRAKPH